METAGADSLGGLRDELPWAGCPSRHTDHPEVTRIGFKGRSGRRWNSVVTDPPAVWETQAGEREGGWPRQERRALPPKPAGRAPGALVRSARPGKRHRGVGNEVRAQNGDSAAERTSGVRVWLALRWVAVGHVAVFTRPSGASGPRWHFRPVGHE